MAVLNAQPLTKPFYDKHHRLLLKAILEGIDYDLFREVN
jgi:hypothetical protein